MVVADDDKDACHCHDDQGDGVTASEREQGYGEKHCKAHRCHRHEADGEQNDDKNGKADQPCEPVNKPHACKEGEHCLAPLKAVPDGECVTEHATKKGCRRAKLGFSVQRSNGKSCGKNGKNRFANVDRHNAKGCGGKAVDALKIGKTGVFAAKLANVLAVNQAREDNGAVDAAEQIGNGGKRQASEIKHWILPFLLRFVFGIGVCR